MDQTTIEEFYNWYKEQKLLYASKKGKTVNTRVCIYVYVANGLLEIEIKNGKHDEIIDRILYSNTHMQDCVNDYNNL